MLQWIAALKKIAATSHYAGKNNRFDSFAPIRMNVSAQWLVDGVSALSLGVGVCGMVTYDDSCQRDYFWNLSRAILLAKDTIYIHDWWLSPG